MAHATLQEALDALVKVDFPAGKDGVLAAARAAGASEEVLKALRGVPAEEYGTRDEVARSVRVDPASDLPYAPAQKAEQARLGGRPGLSEHFRDVPATRLEEELSRPAKQRPR